MKYLVGIDLGTSGLRSAIYNTAGTLIASKTAEYPLYQPQNGWAEQNPEDWLNACVKTLKAALDISGVPAGSIAAIGLSGQMHGLVLLDKNGDSLRNSILWCDGRTNKQCAELTEKIGESRLIEISANPALPGFTAGKILWLRENEPETYKKIRHILLPKDYLRYKLCDVFATDVSDASGTNLLDVPNRRWSAEILKALDINPDFLPPVYESSHISGYTSPRTEALTGIKAGTPVAAGAGDNAAAAIGVGVAQNGSSFLTVGTSGVIFAHSDDVIIDPGGRVHTFCSAVPGAYSVMSCTLAAGGSLKWFRDNFCGEEIKLSRENNTDPYTLMEKEASASPAGSNRLIFMPYLMGERSPILNSDARGLFFGLSGIHKKSDLIRAVMEGVAYSQRDCLEVFRQMRVSVEKLTITGGGAKSPLWRQIFADALALPVTAAETAEGPALGAAMLAGVGAGIYNTVPSACSALLRPGETQYPNMAAAKKYGEYFNLYRDIYSRLTGQFSALASL